MRRALACALALVLPLGGSYARAEGTLVNGVHRDDVPSNQLAFTGTLGGCIYRGTQSLQTLLVAANLGPLLAGQLLGVPCDANGYPIVTLSNPPASSGPGSVAGTDSAPDVVRYSTNSTPPLAVHAATDTLQATGNGSLSNIAASDAAIAGVTGTSADGPYTGTGSGTLDAIQKAIYGQLSGTVKVQDTATRANDAGTMRLQSHDDQLAGVLAQNTTTATAQGASGPGTNPGSGVLGWLSGIYVRLASLLTVTQPDVRGTGTIAAGTANAAYTVPLAGAEGVVGFAVSGLSGSAATLAVEGSNDGGTWSAVNAVTPGTGALSTALSADGQARVNAGGHAAVRLRIATTGTGTVTVASTASSVSSLVGLSAPLPAGTNAIGTVAQGTPGLAANPWPVVDTRRVTLTQTQVSVLAATSTLLLAANPARRSLRIAGTNAGDSFRLGYGVAASATSSALFGSGGVFTAEQYGPGDGVPTGAIYAYSATAFLAQVGEGN